jgi:hypothetical protein
MYIWPGDDLKVEMFSQFNDSTLCAKELCMNIDYVKLFNICDVEMYVLSSKYFLCFLFILYIVRHGILLPLNGIIFISREVKVEEDCYTSCLTYQA